MEDVRQEAAEKWNVLSDDEKAVYEAMAKQYNDRGKGELHNKFTSDGRPIALVLQEEEEKLRQRREMVDNTNKFVDDIGSLEDLKHQSFYIISFNILCEANGVYYPLEIGLIEYTIARGFTRGLHNFIKPGPIPLGFASLAKDHSENTHGIPIQGYEDAESNYEKLVQDIFNFVQVDLDSDDPLPPLFCPDKHIAQALGCLRWLEERSRMLVDFQVWDILPLLRKLRLMAGEEISHAEAEGILNTALYDYEMKSLCSFHLEIDNKNCALGESRRLAYKLSNALMGAYKIDRCIEYQHLPPRLDPDLSIEVSQMNLRPSRFGRGYSTRRVPPMGGGDYYRPSQPAYPGSAIPRENRNVADYYDEQTGPRVRAADNWGTHQPGCSSVSVDSGGDDFPSLSDSMQSRPAKPKSGRTYSSAVTAPSDRTSGGAEGYRGGASYSNISDTASVAASERSAVPPSVVSTGARPKARLAAQFPEPPVLQGLGRGTIPGAEQPPPRRPQNEPPYRGIGRGNM